APIGEHLHSRAMRTQYPPAAPVSGLFPTSSRLEPSYRRSDLPHRALIWACSRRSFTRRVCIYNRTGVNWNLDLISLLLDNPGGWRAVRRPIEIGSLTQDLPQSAPAVRLDGATSMRIWRSATRVVPYAR